MMTNLSRVEEDDDSLEQINKIVSELAKEKPQLFTHQQLESFTSGFNNKVGYGAFGDVYKGEFPDGTQIVAKVLKNNLPDVIQRQYVTKQQFIAEVSTMGRTHHRNLIKLYGFCFEADLKALVYEYMENGSLDRVLYENHLRLEWVELYDIAIETAKGISYLHENCNPTIIHHDIKAANVLLDSNLSPKVTDFGLAKLCNMNVSQVAQSQFRGTGGYAAPEVCFGSKLITYKCDVYSFGMMLFEILRRKNNHDGKDWFPGKFWEYFENKQLDEILVECGIMENDKEKAKRLSMVALTCAHSYPQDRPSMSTVVKMLEGYIEPQPPKINPFPYYDSSSGESSLSSGPRRTRTLPMLAASDKSLVVEDAANKEFASSHTLTQFLKGSTDDEKVVIPTRLPTDDESFFSNLRGLKSRFHLSSIIPSWGRPNSGGPKKGSKLTPATEGQNFGGDQKGSKLTPATIEVPILSSDIVKEKTGNFGDQYLIGEGSHGRVYYANLNSGKAVVIKKLDTSSESNFEFFSQCEKMAMILLHGTLHVTIFEADSIENPDRATGAAPKFFRRPVVGVGKGTSKLYATIDLEKARVGQTRMIEKEPINPRWYESFHIYCAHSASNVVFTVKDDNPIGATLIGRAYMPVEELLNGEEVDRWLDILDDDKNPVEGGARIHVKLQYFDVSKDRNWSRGIRSQKFPGVPYTFFTQRHGCRVSLYQDAHVPDNFIPKIPLSDGKYYEPHRCWEDIFDAISNARHLIYITGWSVYTETSLVRDSRRPKPEGDITIGELLKKKASEGVRVLMLVSDDRTSVDLLKKDGLMATHDEETSNYFKGSDVHCVLCPRNPDNGGSIVQDLQISTMFTHHQKIVVVDGDMTTEGSQQIVSFVGGIDLCDGRYDTAFHSLFRTLDIVHHDDFHQPNFPDASITKGGPREPWHDIHCRLEGPIAWDVLYNFEQRWRKQGGKDLLVQLRDLADSIIPPSPVMFQEDRETWNVQLFRSIDGGAAFGFPETPEDAARAGLVSRKDNIIDRSIQDAYINAIRRAKNFIYIENQYFLGSSFSWKPDGIKCEDVGCLHLIPKELSLKIVSKIEAGERFTVYVVVPMWPEGIPESGSVQAILDWQKRTMEMMYTDIIQAFEAKGIQANPKEYLTFFCLGNREVKKSGEYAPAEQPEPDTDYSRAQVARRFMIYVHSKMMIVDDEYIIIGSANINQRSMDGARDSEIAMGAYQPHQLAAGQPARGQIHGFRMALWYEHLGMLDATFLQPDSVECVQKVNKIADKYWDLFSSETLERDLPGYLLAYPVGVSSDGVVTELPGTEFFPDTKARVLGAKSDYLPPILTT